jgi:ribosomal protein S18 acetylase RimI-like enzyme
MTQSDVSVRPAVAGDEAAIARIQLEAWTCSTAIGEAVVALMDPDQVRTSWRTAIVDPPGPGYRVLVALAGPHVVGFSAVVPVPGDDGAATAGEILALEVASGSQRQGHGSRLLSAVVDHLRQDRAGAVSTWLLDEDDVKAQFYGEAGLGRDGARRELTGQADPVSGTVLVESRWSAQI